MRQFIRLRYLVWVAVSLQGKKMVSMSYYLAPEEAMDDPSEMADWARRAYAAAKRSKK